MCSRSPAAARAARRRPCGKAADHSFPSSDRLVPGRGKETVVTARILTPATGKAIVADRFHARILRRGDILLRDSTELLAPAVAETIAALALKPEDAAAVKLAQRYAAAIDADAAALDFLGPKLLAVLEGGGVGVDGCGVPLGELD